MKKTFLVLTLVFTMSMLFGCMGPPKVEQLITIEANETAFLVPLEGATKKNQQSFMSVDYLNSNKVATKRISLPLRKFKTGRLWYSYKWIPTMCTIKVNRAPVTQEWTGDSTTGTSSKDQALWVESQDSIGFGVGVNLTAMIKEENSSLFLYTYAGEKLKTIVDNNVRGYVNSILSREFAKYELEDGRKKKNEIFDLAATKTKTHFSLMGITITNLGLAEGLVYEDKEIQQAINDKFTAEMQIQIEKQKKFSQAEVNEKNISIATAEKDAAIEFQKAADARKQQVQVDIDKMLAQARLTMAENWNGELPSKIIPGDSPLLFSLQGDDN